MSVLFRKSSEAIVGNGNKVNTFKKAIPLMYYKLH